MTLNQLLKETYALGFEENTELNDSFLFSANRALRMIYSEIAYEKSASIILNIPKISYYCERYEHASGKAITFDLIGVSLSFKHSGNGFFSIRENGTSRNFSFSGNGTQKIFFSEKCELTFYGELSFLILDLTSFSERISDKESDIPIYALTSKIDLGRYIDDFCSPSCQPTDNKGNTIPKASISGNVLEIPFGWSGEIIIRYKPAPPALSINELNAEFSLPLSSEPLLPILTASYLWLDDDAEKAEYYASIYRTEMNRIILNCPKNINTGYEDVTGWA